MYAIVTAGGIPKPDEPLFEFSQGRSKSLIDIAGKPMIQWVLDALGGAKNVDQVVIIGLDQTANVTCGKPVHYLPNQGSMLANMVAGFSKVLEIDPTAQYVIIASSDIPDLKSNMIDWLVAEVEKEPADLYYGVVKKETMEQTYPNSRRTWTRLKDMEVCGADINVAHVTMATEHLPTWETLIGRRKSPLKQAAAIGFWTLILMLTRQATLQQLVGRVSRSIGIKGKAIIWPWAEAGMDVDKPHQLELMRASMQKQIS